MAKLSQRTENRKWFWLALPGMVLGGLIYLGVAEASPLRQAHQNPEICSPGWTDNWVGPMPLIRCPIEVEWLHDLVEVDPEVLSPDSPQLLSPEETLEMLEEAGWQNNPQPTDAMRAMMDELAPLGRSEFTDPVWQWETGILEFWIDPDADPAQIYTVAEQQGVPTSDFAIMRRQFSLAQLVQARDALWTEGIDGQQINSLSIRYDGTGIDISVTGPFDGPTDEPIAEFYGVPVYAPWGALNIQLVPAN